MGTTRLAVSATAILLFMAHAAAAQELEPAQSIVGASTAVPAEVELTIHAEWQVGDTYRIDYSAERITRRNGELETHGSWAVITMRVEERSPDGYVVAWTNEDLGLSDRAQHSDAKVKELEAYLVEMARNLRTEIVTADTGFPTSLRNIEEMMSHMKSLSEKFVSMLESQPEKQGKFRSFLQHNLTAQFIQTRGLMDAYLVYGLMGGTYRGGQVDTYDTEVPFPFGGPPIPATTYVLLREYDEQAGLARITSQSIPDAAQLNDAMLRWMTRMAKSQGQPPPHPSQVPDLRIQDTTVYLYDFNMGLPREVVSEKFIRVAGSDDIRIDRRTYRISPLP